MSDIIVGYMQDGDLESIRKYIDQLGSINEYIYQDEENCLSLIHLAAGLDSIHRENVLELLIANRADLNCPGMSENVQHVRPLHLAAMWGYDLTVKLLLYHGADASLKDENGLSPVDYASIFDNYLCISLLLRYGSLNSTAAAWSAIMDSSLGESRGADSSLDESMINRTLQLARLSPSLHMESKINSQINRYTYKEHDNHKRDNSDRPYRDEYQTFPMKLDHDSPSRSLDIEYDPFGNLNESEVRKNLELDNQRLRLELCRLGRNPGPITDTTKKLYAKLLTRLISEDKELVYSPRTKTNSELNGYSNELNSIITGKFSIKQALDLEKELLRISGLRDHHGPKQFFNYILIDPRISNNLPDQATEWISDTDVSIISYDQETEPHTNSDENNNISTNLTRTDRARKPKIKKSPRQLNRKFQPKFFTKFLESIFYIGKGQKRRDLMHLYDALADRNSITQKKIDRIRDIWNDGYGVVSLHLFHNITSKEALTREAVMIETIGLQNLTNLVKGTLQIKLAWNEHKRKQLGALLLHRAYNQLLNEGERQLRRDDLNYKK